MAASEMPWGSVSVCLQTAMCVSCAAALCGCTSGLGAAVIGTKADVFSPFSPRGQEEAALLHLQPPPSWIGCLAAVIAIPPSPD